jgi:hypothetical protein
VHEELQHTPSTQKLEAHCEPLLQDEPMPSRPLQVPPRQVFPLAQSFELAQLVLHAIAPHTYGVHGVVTLAGQWPVPSQLAAAVCVPPAQLGAVHWTVG